MGTRFFKLVGVFSYGLAALALFSTVTLGISAASNYLGGVDDSVSTPELTFEDYQTHVAPEPEPSSADTETPNQPIRDQRSDEELEADRLIKEFVQLVWKYNEVTNQDDPSPEGIKQWIYQVTRDLADEQARVLFLRSLNETVREDLVEPAQEGDNSILSANTPGLDDSSSKYVSWDQYLEWYTRAYMEAYYEELDRIEAETQQVLKDKQDALVTATAAAIAFLLFILATLVLVLVRIEHNTRPG